MRRAINDRPPRLSIARSASSKSSTLTFNVFKISGRLKPFGSVMNSLSRCQSLKNVLTPRMRCGIPLFINVDNVVRGINND